MPDPLVSIIIVNHNGRKHLSGCLGSLKRNDYHNHEIIFVDNASSDKSIDYVKEHHPHARIIRSEENLGFAGGNNLGIKHAKGDYCLLLNNDTHVPHDFLSSLIDVMKDDKSIGIAGSITVPMPLKRRKIRFPFRIVEEFPAVCGAAMLIDKRVIDRIGLLDETLFLYSEDTDYCWRAILAGFRVVYVYRSVVFHELGGSTQGNDKWLYLKYRNQIYVHIKTFRGIDLSKRIAGLLVKTLFHAFLTNRNHPFKTPMYSLDLSLHKIGSLAKAWIWNIGQMGRIKKTKSNEEDMRRLTQLLNRERILLRRDYDRILMLMEGEKI